ncbi:MAG: apolipoprotein N-acyltransferase [Acidisphaera sp.]|nr:apolipoprotein N-acyltransferase [Acidisphaera sp.]
MVSRLLQRLEACRGWRAGLAAAALGALAAAALPPLFALPVLLIAVPGLLALLAGAPTPRTAFGLGFWFAFGNNLVGLYWITEAILVEAARYWWFVPIAVPGLSAILAVFVGAACAIAWFAPPGWRRLLALAGAWVLGDLARQYIGTGFPWNLWGSVWELPGAPGDLLIQPAAWVSVHGLTLATLLLAGMPRFGWRGWATGGAGLLVWAGFGLWRVTLPEPAAPGITAVLVQGNVAEGQKWDTALMEELWRRHLALTAEGVAKAGPGAKVVIWPETASAYPLQDLAGSRIPPAATAGERADIAAAAGGAPTLIGSIRFDAEGMPRNSLVAFVGDAPVAAVYDKWHLVPGGEYQPSWLPLPVQIAPGSFAFGPGPRTLRIPGLPPVGPLICYEAIFPGEVVDESDRPDWMVNITNDAWFGNSTGPRQHLAAARMRAVEEGLPLLRAANTGISASFDARGRERARLGLDRVGVLVTYLPGKLPPTPFARLGLLIPGGLAALLLWWGLMGEVLPAGLFRKNRTHLPKRIFFAFVNRF